MFDCITIRREEAAFLPRPESRDLYAVILMSIAMLLDMAASAYDSRTALGREADGMSYESLRRTVTGGAGVIRASAAGSVAFIGLNGPAFPSLLMASAVAGVPFSPLNYRLSKDGLAELLARLDRPLVVVDEAFEDAVLQHGQVMTVEAWLSAASAAQEAPAADVADEDCAVLLFTSGTTGRPKGVVLRHENLVSYVIGTVEFASADPDEAVLVSVPPYHVAGDRQRADEPLRGPPDGVPAEFRPRRVAGHRRAGGGHRRDGGPDDAGPHRRRAGGDAGGGPHAALDRLRRGAAAGDGVGTGAAAVSRGGLRQRVRPDRDQLDDRGADPEDHREALGSDDPDVRARLTSAGRPVPGIDVEVRGADGRPVASGEAGELWVRGPQVSGVYEGIGSVLDADGWFPTRDRARVDSGGYLFIEGRADDTIIRGGENIAPAEIEDVLIGIPPSGTPPWSACRTRSGANGSSRR